MLNKLREKVKNAKDNAHIYIPMPVVEVEKIIQILESYEHRRDRNNHN